MCTSIVGNRLCAVIHAGVHVRPATQDDLSAINDLYNHYVQDSHVTFDLEPTTLEVRGEWFEHYADKGPHRIFVAVDDGHVIGFASSSPFKSRPGYATSVETSVYVAPEHVGKGTGARLYDKVFDALKGEDLHRAYAGIALPNPASIALHERFGFKRVALFTEPGRKFGRYWDVAWFEKPLDEKEG
jgi:phosphinothricin acetyltransferase